MVPWWIPANTVHEASAIGTSLVRCRSKFMLNSYGLHNGEGCPIPYGLQSMHLLSASVPFFQVAVTNAARS